VQVAVLGLTSWVMAALVRFMLLMETF
jgi:hypothetical protein